jgi:hypothetical protein
MSWHDLFRIGPGTTQSLSVVSAGGSAVSTSVFGAETFSLQLVALGSVTSTSGVRFRVGPGAVVNSTTDAVIPVNWVHNVRCSPGEKLSALGADGAAYTLYVTEVTD